MGSHTIVTKGYLQVVHSDYHANLAGYGDFDGRGAVTIAQSFGDVGGFKPPRPVKSPSGLPVFHLWMDERW